MATRSIPDRETQKKEVGQVILNEKYSKGDIWYLVDKNWLDKWKQYVNLYDVSSDAECQSPGPVDNTNLLQQTKAAGAVYTKEGVQFLSAYLYSLSHKWKALGLLLRIKEEVLEAIPEVSSSKDTQEYLGMVLAIWIKHQRETCTPQVLWEALSGIDLREKWCTLIAQDQTGSRDELPTGCQQDDYCSIPAIAWNKLVEWYGITANSRPIPRVVARSWSYCHPYTKATWSLEINPLEIKLCVHPKEDSNTSVCFSKNHTVGFLESVMRGIFCVSEGVECRIWNPTSVLKEPEQTLQNCSDGHVMILEIRRTNGTWPKDPVDESIEISSQMGPKCEDLPQYRASASASASTTTLGVALFWHQIALLDMRKLSKEDILRNRLDSAEKEITGQKLEIERVKEGRDHIIHNLRQRCITQESSLITLRKKVETLQADLSESHRTTLSAQLADKQLQSAQEEKEVLQKEKKSLQKLIGNIVARVDELSLNLKSANDATETAQRDLRVQKILKELATEKQTKLQNEVIGLQKCVQTEQQRSREAIAHAEELDSQLHKATQATEEAQRQISVLSRFYISQRHTLQQQLESAEQSNQQAQRKISDLESQLSTVQEQVRVLQQQLHQERINSERKQQCINRLEEQLRESEQTNLQTQQELTVVTRDCREAQQRADNLDQRLREAELRLSTSDQVFQDMLQRLLGQVPHSQPLWVVQRNEVQLTEEELGTGGWASIKVALFRGQRVAAKCLHHQIISAHNIRLFTREMNMAAQARHPNLLQFIGATMDDTPIILTELMPTSLRRILEQGVHLIRRQILSIASDVARGLNYLHLITPDPIIHRDVSSANVLLEAHGPDGNYKAKVSDYGSANFVRYTATAGPGNPLYSAPEAHDPKRHSPKMDVYSFGLLLVEMCSGELFDDHEELIRTRIHDWPEMVRIIRPCIRQEPDRRPTMNQVLTELSRLNIIL